MYVYICVYIFIIYMCVYIHNNIFIHIHVERANINIKVFKYIIYVYVRRMCVLLPHTATYSCVYEIYICVYVYVCICMYIHVHAPACLETPVKNPEDENEEYERTISKHRFCKTLNLKLLTHVHTRTCPPRKTMPKTLKVKTKMPKKIITAEHAVSICVYCEKKKMRF